MATYNFRIKFKFIDEDNLKLKENKSNSSLSFEIGCQEFEIEPCDSNNTSTYIIKGGTYEDEIVALKMAHKIMNGLYNYSLQYKRGLDFGDYIPKSLIYTQYFERILSTPMIQDTYGITIYPSGKKVTFIRANPIKVVLSQNINNFKEKLQDGFLIDKTLSDKEKLTLQLFNNSFFETSETSRFLFLMITLESMLEFEPRSNDAINIIDSFKLSIKNNIKDVDERNSLIGTLEFLKNESIIQSGKKLTMQFFSKDEIFFNKTPAQFFKICYSLRSNIVHKGQQEYKSISPKNIQGELTNFISCLISRKIYGI